MILVTVGTDLPFDRLMKAVDQWAARSGRTDLFAQIGEGGWRPEHIPSKAFLEPTEFKERFAAASLIVSHAGMGTILSALHHQKPILVMPRRASLGEQRNEHQLATAKHLETMGKITVALDEADLAAKLDRLHELQVRGTAGPYASPELCAGIQKFILNGRG